MSKYPMIEAMGLKVIDDPSLYTITHWIAANRLEKALSEAPEVFGHVKEGKPNYWGPKENGQFKDTHTARIFCVQPIKRAPMKLTIEDTCYESPEVTKELNKFSGKRVRITIEEIQEKGQADG